MAWKVTRARELADSEGETDYTANVEENKLEQHMPENESDDCPDPSSCFLYELFHGYSLRTLLCGRICHSTQSQAESYVGVKRRRSDSA